MRLREWLRPPRQLLLPFLAVVFVLALGLGWLSWRLLQQDRALVSQSIQEHLNYAADLIGNALLRKLTEAESQLNDLLALTDSELAARATALVPSLGGNALVTVWPRQGLEVYPETRLLYYPFVSPSREPPAGTFAEGEAAEFKAKDYATAIATFRKLARSPDQAIRAGALLRLGRNLRKAQQPTAALAAYQELGQLGSTRVEGLPTELIARHTRCVLLEELNRREELQHEASALYADLQSGRWLLTRAAYQFYAQETRRWFTPDAGLDRSQQDALVLATGVEALWGKRQGIRRGAVPPSGSETVWVEDHAVLLVWRSTSERMVAEVAGPRYLEKHWFAALESEADRQGVLVALTDSEGRPVLGQLPGTPRLQAFRNPSETHLPWALRVASVDPHAEVSQLARRRHLLLASLFLIATVVLVGTYFITRAITKELEIRQLQSDFVSAVSHEFRTPLASLRQLSELLADGRVPSEERRLAYYTGLRRETERLQRLVESLLEFGRMEAGARQYRFEPIDPATLVHRVAEEFAQHLADDGYRIDAEAERSLPPIRVDPEAISRALWNLLDNAVKYSPGQRVVRVEAARSDDRVAISVRDCGLGIRPNEQRQIFNKFVRAESAKAAGIPGTGLGLAMVEHIVRAHGGKISVESRVGEGSTFTILLPTSKE